MLTTLHPFAGIVAIVLLLLFWPLAQRLRHDKLSPLAAYLLFTSMFALVGAAVFMLALWIGMALLPPGAMDGPTAATITGIIAIASAFAAANWIVRRPQTRRKPR